MGICYILLIIILISLILGVLMADKISDEKKKFIYSLKEFILKLLGIAVILLFIIYFLIPYINGVKAPDSSNSYSFVFSTMKLTLSFITLIISISVLLKLIKEEY